MKKIIISITTAIASVGILSCSLLEENPTTQLAETNIFSSETSVEAVLKGCYRWLYGPYLFQGEHNEFIHTCSGLIDKKSGSSRYSNYNYTCQGRFTQYSINSYPGYEYSGLYEAVSRCNDVLDHLPSSPVDSGFKTEIEGEAKFLRGMLYYFLVRLFGDVPLVTSCPKSIEEMYVKRTPYYKVYAQILRDLEDAEKMMRTQARVVEVTGGTQSRPCNFAATAFKASVYMQIGSILDSPEDQFFDLSKEGRAPDFSECGIHSAKNAWEKCLEAAEKVINEGPYQLAPKFGDLFRWTDPEDFCLPERIFVLPACAQQSSGIYTAIRGLPEYPAGTSNYVTENKNWGRWRPSRFIFQKWCETYPGSMGTGTYNSHIFVSSADPRLNLSMIYGTYKNLKGDTNNIYPANGSTCVYGNSAYSMPFSKKYLDPRYDANAGYADYYMMRFAEMFLIAAEACASLSEAEGDEMWNKAFDYVEVIHARARHSVEDGQPDAAEPIWDKATRFRGGENPKQDLVAGIMWERFYEMIGEGHEFYDTHRRGATWLRDEIAIPKNIFLRKDEQYSTTNPNGKAVDIPWTQYQYGDLEFQHPTDVQELRRSIIMGFPREALQKNLALDEILDQNDFIWQ